MDRSPAPFVTTMFATLALSALVVGAVVGHPLVLLACVAVAVVAGITTVTVLAAYRVSRVRDPPERRSATGSRSARRRAW